jgi:HSP20 family protein
MNTGIEETIDRVEQLYMAITGRQPPQVDASTTRIPPEIDPVRHVEEQLGKLVTAVEQQLAPEVVAAPAPAWTPRAFAWQHDAAFELAIDMPGVPRERIELSIEGPRLAVRGERPTPWGDGETRSPETCEAPLGRFARTFVLPELVDPAQITARLDAGVLRVRIARRAATHGSTIPIQG